jgi:hypothetical protein
MDLFSEEDPDFDVKANKNKINLWNSMKEEYLFNCNN